MSVFRGLRRMGLAAAALIALSGAAAAAVTDGAGLEGLVQSTGYKYEKKTDRVFALSFSGKTLKDFNVVVAMDEKTDFVIVFTTIADHTRFTADTGFLLKLAHANNDMDQVKVGLDDDGDLFVRIDTRAHLLDQTELKADIDQVASASDEIAADVGLSAAK